jgi:flagellar basal-body rod protein FlgB
MALVNLLGAGATDALEQAIGFAADRHRVLADDLANVDTPGFLMKDLSVPRFQQELVRALEQGRRADPGTARIRLDRRPDGSARTGDAAGLRSIVFHDGNDRNVETLVVELTKNAQRHAQAVSLLRSQIRLLRAVISETVA